MQIPEHLQYTKDHEWILIENNVCTIGITDYAQDALGDIVFIELPEIARKCRPGQSIGIIESIKSVNDLYSPCAGEVVEINMELENRPESCNSSPYESWIVRIKIDSNTNLDQFLTPEKYLEVCQSN